MPNKLVSDDGLSRYLVEVRRFPLLSREVEHELAKQYKDDGDLTAAHKLVTSNMRLVVKIAFEYQRSGMKLMDLIQEGNIGLMQAVKEFNPYQGTRLSTYAVYWIKAYIQNYLLKNFSMVKIGTTQAQRKLYYQLRKEQQKLKTMGIDPSVKLLAENLDVTEDDIALMDQRLSGRDMSLDVPVTSDNTRTTFLDLQTDNAKGADDVIADQELSDMFQKYIHEFKKELNEKQLYIFDNRILSEDPITLQQIGDKYEITRERARQLEAAIIKKLKKFMKEHAPDIDQEVIRDSF